MDNWMLSIHCRRLTMRSALQLVLARAGRTAVVTCARVTALSIPYRESAPRGMPGSLSGPSSVSVATFWRSGTILSLRSKQAPHQFYFRFSRSVRGDDCGKRSTALVSPCGKRNFTQHASQSLVGSLQSKKHVTTLSLSMV